MADDKVLLLKVGQKSKDGRKWLRVTGLLVLDNTFLNWNRDMLDSVSGVMHYVGDLTTDQLSYNGVRLEAGPRCARYARKMRMEMEACTFDKYLSIRDQDSATAYALNVEMRRALRGEAPNVRFVVTTEKVVVYTQYIGLNTLRTAWLAAAPA